MKILSIISFLNSLKNAGQGRYIKNKDIVVSFNNASINLWNSLIDSYQANQSVTDLLRPFKRINTEPIPITNGKADLPEDYAYGTSFWVKYPRTLKTTSASTDLVTLNVIGHDAVDGEFLKVLGQSREITATTINTITVGTPFESLIPDKTEFKVSGKGSEKEIDMLRDSEFRSRKSSKLLPPTEEYPIGKIEANQISVAPETLDVPQGDQTSGVYIEYLKKPTDVQLFFTLSTDGRTEIVNEQTSIDTEWDERALPELIKMMATTLGITLNDGWLTQYQQAKQ